MWGYLGHFDHHGKQMADCMLMTRPMRWHQTVELDRPLVKWVDAQKNKVSAKETILLDSHTLTLHLLSAGLGEVCITPWAQLEANTPPKTLSPGGEQQREKSKCECDVVLSVYLVTNINTPNPATADGQNMQLTLQTSFRCVHDWTLFLKPYFKY